MQLSGFRTCVDECVCQDHYRSSSHIFHTSLITTSMQLLIYHHHPRSPITIHYIPSSIIFHHPSFSIIRHYPLPFFHISFIFHPPSFFIIHIHSTSSSTSGASSVSSSVWVKEEYWDSLLSFSSCSSLASRSKVSRSSSSGGALMSAEAL